MRQASNKNVVKAAVPRPPSAPCAAGQRLPEGRTRCKGQNELRNGLVVSAPLVIWDLSLQAHCLTDLSLQALSLMSCHDAMIEPKKIAGKARAARRFRSCKLRTPQGTGTWGLSCDKPAVILASQWKCAQNQVVFPGKSSGLQGKGHGEGT